MLFRSFILHIPSKNYIAYLFLTNMKSLKKLLLLVCIPALFACSNNKVDALYYNGTVYTVNENFETAEAFVVKDGKFIAVGKYLDLREKYAAKEEIDLNGAFVYPGFIDGHCHFYRYGLGLQQVDLGGAASYDEMVDRVVKHAAENPSDWILGRGWDQNLWPDKKFPTRKALDELFPDKPVLLIRVDGHAAVANAKALELGGITANTKMVGGLVELINGEMSGILIDNAIDLVSAKIPEKSVEEKKAALLKAQENCFEVGLTTVVDAGLEKETIDLIDELHKGKLLQMRIYAMLNPSEGNKKHYFKNGIYKTDYLNVRSFKIYADGALGSRGACLLQHYSDQPRHLGFLLQEPKYFKEIAIELNKYGFQMNTHCIGDSANRHVLDVYGEVLGGKNDKRWRIEHAQVISPTDFVKFADYSVIPSVQTTHATSDMYWAGERLGTERLKGAYAYQDLIKQFGLIANGSDFPVEGINPLWGFYAAVARQDDKLFPEGGFQMDNAMSRADALRGMTIWAAFANFEEKEKGSIEAGKFADFVILEKDIMTVPIREARDVKVKSTFVNGVKVF